MTGVQSPQVVIAPHVIPPHVSRARRSIATSRCCAADTEPLPVTFDSSRLALRLAGTTKRCVLPSRALGARGPPLGKYLGSLTLFVPFLRNADVVVFCYSATHAKVTKTLRLRADAITVIPSPSLALHTPPRTLEKQPMKKPDDVVWEDIRRAHVANEEALPIIANRYRVTLAQIRYRARKEGWPNRPNAIIARAARLAGQKAGKPKPAKAKRSKSTPTQRARPPTTATSNVVVLKRSATLTRTLVKRARERLADKLDNLRIQLTDGRRRKTTDSERESRDLLGIINGIAKTQEIENELHRLAHAAGPANGRVRDTAIDPADLAERAEALRRTLADNIARRRQPQ